MASIKKRATKAGDVRYVVRFRVNGRTDERWFRTLVAARSYKTRIEADTQDGVLIDPRAGAQSLDDYFISWVADRLVKGRPLAASTRLGYEGVYRRHIAPWLGARELRTLRPDTIRTWHSQVTATASQDQAAKSYRVLRAVLATAEADEVIRQNPCRIRGGGGENRPERPMLATSLVLELAEEIESRYRAMVLLAGFAGLRTGENLGLHRRDIDLLHAEVRVERQSQEIAGRGRIEVVPKSDAGRRIVALPGVVVEALDHHLATYTGHDPDSPLFTGPSAPRSGGPPSPPRGRKR